MPKKQKIRRDAKKEMKMKKNENEEDEDIFNFTDMGLDERLLFAIETVKWYEPTPIQETAIPIILEGKDVLAQARTGSGKTGAYMIPLLQKILKIKKQVNKQQCTIGLILAPSRELCQQIINNLNELCQYCQRELTFIDLGIDVPMQQQKCDTCLPGTPNPASKYI
jgi:ATP-dependent RNA helicase DDX56/DBP9